MYSKVVQLYTRMHACWVAHSCMSLCNPLDCSTQGSSVHGILQARILEWVVISFSRGSSWPRDWTWVFCIEGRSFTIWSTREALSYTCICMLFFIFLSIQVNHRIVIGHKDFWEVVAFGMSGMFLAGERCWRQWGGTWCIADGSLGLQRSERPLGSCGQRVTGCQTCSPGSLKPPFRTPKGPQWAADQLRKHLVKAPVSQSTRHIFIPNSKRLGVRHNTHFIFVFLFFCTD